MGEFTGHLIDTTPATYNNYRLLDVFLAKEIRPLSKSNKRKVVSLPAVPKNGAAAEIQRIAREETENMFALPHAQNRMIERGILFRQVLNVLRDGDLVSGPIWDPDKEQGWRCRFRRITAGFRVDIVAKLVERGDTCVLVVTAFK